MRMKNLYIATLFVFMCIFIGHAAVKRYIKPIGSGTQSGLSWENAMGNLQQTINISASGDTIWVASGNYAGGFTLKQGVQIYGGFNGQESFLTERKLPGTGVNLTVLDGKNTQRVVNQISAFTVSTVLDGFVIQNGLASYGAGVSINSNSILRRCIVHDNCASEIKVGDYIPTQGGVVVRIDKKGGIAYVVATRNQGQTYQSGIGSLIAKNVLDTALLDMSGQTNTKLMTDSRVAKAVTEYVADAPGNGFTDWYIPSAGEWGLLISGGPFMGGRSEICNIIEQTLTANNKQTFEKDKFWTSTPASSTKNPEMWYSDFGTMSLNSMSALQNNRLRAMRGFTLNTGFGTGGGIYAISGALIEGCLVYNNSASEGSGVYTLGNVPIHYSTIVNNKQSAAGYANSFGLVTDVYKGSTQTSGIINSIIWGNKDFDNQASNVNLTTTKSMLYSAWESVNAVVGTGDIALPEDNNAENGIKFKNPANFDYHLYEISVCAITGNKSQMPAGLTTDLNGNPRSTTIGRSMGAFESDYLENGVPNLLNDNEITVYPNPVRRGTSLTVMNHSNYLELRVSVVNLTGQVISSKKYSSTTEQVQMPNETGTYFVKFITNEGVSLNKKITVY
jgi:hypothetical protein